MKKIILLFVFLLPILLTAQEQKPVDWPHRTNSLAVYGMIGFANGPSFNFESITHKGKINHGPGVGISYSFTDYGEGTGAQLYYTGYTGKKNNHFEAKLGGVYYPKDGFFWPIITIGYRYQKPEGKGFFRLGIGTGGLGIGYGFLI